MSLTTAEAEKILQAAKAKATEMGLRVSIAVVDTRGELMTMVRLDGARWPTARVCQGKAYASVTYGVPSADLAQRAVGPIFRNMMIQEGGTPHTGPGRRANQARRRGYRGGGGERGRLRPGRGDRHHRSPGPLGQAEIRPGIWRRPRLQA